MVKPLYTWILFGLCMLIVLGAMGWISLTVLKLDRAEEEARQRELVEERVRLALWRMDTVAGRIVAAATARPREYTGAAELPEGNLIRAWFELDDKGRVRWQSAPLPPLAGIAPAPQQADLVPVRQQDLAQAKTAAQQQQVANTMEFQARQRVVSQQMEQVLTVNQPLPAPPQAGGPLKPRWAGKELLLMRTVERGEGSFSEGCVVHLPVLRGLLLSECTDILPNARLARPPAGDQVDPGRQLVSLPLVLDPGPDPLPYIWRRPWSPSQLMLLIAWSCMLLPAAGLALLLIAAVSLSERRGAFVSAVTHELRTPLTTFRMYTEMLAEGMVPEARQQEYIETLRTEADRLSHMVENVLAYARLERGRRQDELETVDLTALVNRCSGQLRDRTDRAGMQLELPDGGDVQALADPGAIERIVFNLVDNACKYGRGENPRIHVEVAATTGTAILRVRDHGPGVPSAGQRQLFKPFHKSAPEAARSAPGVGLGLALSRRLARRMGGDLVLEPGDDGASFALRLPRA